MKKAYVAPTMELSIFALEEYLCEDCCPFGWGACPATCRARSFACAKHS